MSSRDFVLLTVVCLILGFNFTVGKIALNGSEDFAAAPPLFFTAMRMLGAALVLAPLLLQPLPRGSLPLVLTYALVHGAIHYGFFYIGIMLAGASAAAMVFPIYAPIASLLAVVFLGDQVNWKRWLGIGLAFTGVVTLWFNADNLALSLGVLAMVGAATAAATSSILNRYIGGGLGPMQSQAWVGAVSFAPLFVVSGLCEQGQWATLTSGGWPFYSAVAFSVIAGTVFAQAALFLILSRNSPTIVTPMSLMTTLWGVIFGVFLLGDPISLQLFAGGALTMVGVLVVMLTGVRHSALRPADRGATAR